MSAGSQVDKATIEQVDNYTFLYGKVMIFIT
jgi:hypothetical protein